ncbi:hypothetical protein Tco_1197443 [Tanacetum coccineum]
MCFKAFTISADVPKIFMQQFWYTIKKVPDTDSYEFLLANKKCTINAEVFRIILDICPRVEGVNFVDVLDDDTTLTFLIDLGYKGPLNRHTNMFVDHMHQPWRTLAAIINKCLSGKTASNALKIDHWKEKRSRCENMPYPRFTKIIINHFLKQHKSLTNLNHKHYQTIKEDGLVSRLKFVRNGEDYQEYGLPIPDVMLTDAIKHSESYQMFIKYLTNHILPKKSRGKGSKGKKTVKESQETIDVSEESEPEPELAKKKTASRRVVKKKVILSADDNIISDDPDAALELDKSFSQTEAEEAEAARKVHATHARIVTESVPESAKKKSSGKSSKSVIIQDTPSAPKSKPATLKTKLKGAPSLTLAEQEATNIMQALKESKKTSRRQPDIRGSNEGTSSKPGVPDESTFISNASRDKQDSEHSDDDNDDAEKDDKDGDADDEGDDHVSDTQDVETESDEGDIYKYKIRVRKDADEEMKDAEIEGSDKGDEKITNAAKEEAEKTSEAKDDTKKTELPPSSSSLSVSSGFGDQFLKLSSDSSLVSTVKDSADANVSSLLDIPIQHESPQIQPLSIQKIPISVILEITNLPPIPEIVTETLVTNADPSPQVTPIISTVQQTTTPIPTPTITIDAPTVTTAIPESNALTAIELRVAKLKKDVFELKTSDHSSVPIAILQSYVPTVVDSYLDTKVGDVFQKELQKHTADLIHKYSLQHLLELTKKPTPTTEQEYEKSPSDILKIKKEQAESQKNPQFTIKNPANHQLYHALTEALIEDENEMDKGVVDIVKDHKRNHDDDEDDDDEDHLAGPNQGKKTKRRRTKESESSKKPSTTKETPKGKTLTKGSKTGTSAPAKEPVEEPITEVIMDDAGDDVARDDNLPQDTSEPKTRKTLNQNWFKQPLRPPTPDPEWSKRQVVLDQPIQLWFNKMVFASKDPLTCNDLMATPIDFFKYVLNGLKIKNLTQDILLGSAFNKLDWNNPEGDRYPFDLSKPLPLQGPPGHRTIAADYFFNNELKYLKKSNLEHAYDKDALMGIKHWGERRKLCVSVKKLHRYGNLEEIVVKRSDQQLYTFKEGDFVDLHLNDIEDMLFLVVQYKLFYLDGNVIVDYVHKKSNPQETC